LVISNNSSFRVLFDKIASVYFIWKMYLYFSIGNGQPREPSLCQLYRHTFVPYNLFLPSAKLGHHWLRVLERITFEVATLMYRALHGSAPPYLASSFTCVADMPHRRRLRSASTEQLDVPTCRRSTIWGRAFPVAGAIVWNGLPSDVTSASSLSVFKNRLKTYLFAAVTTLFDFEWRFLFLVIISRPEDWSLQ